MAQDRCQTESLEQGAVDRDGPLAQPDVRTGLVKSLSLIHI